MLTPTAGVTHHVGMHYTSTSDGVRTALVSAVADMSEASSGSALDDVGRGASALVMAFDAVEEGATPNAVARFVQRLRWLTGLLPEGGPRVPLLVVTTSRETEQHLQVGCFVGVDSSVYDVCVCIEVVFPK